MTEGMFLLALVLVAIAEAADVLSAIFRHTILQSVVREELRGRLTAMNGLFVIGGPNLGQVRAGAVAALVSPQFAVITGGLACVLSAIAVAFWAPELPRYERSTAARTTRRSRTRAGRTPLLDGHHPEHAEVLHPLRALDERPQVEAIDAGCGWAPGS